MTKQVNGAAEASRRSRTTDKDSSRGMSRSQHKRAPARTTLATVPRLLFPLLTEASLLALPVLAVATVPVRSGHELVFVTASLVACAALIGLRRFRVLSSASGVLWATVVYMFFFSRTNDVMINLNTGDQFAIAVAVSSLVLFVAIISLILSDRRTELLYVELVVTSLLMTVVLCAFSLALYGFLHSTYHLRSQSIMRLLHLVASYGLLSVFVAWALRSEKRATRVVFYILLGCSGLLLKHVYLI